MNLYGLEILDELTFIIFSIFFGVLIILAWMSTKVDCDFRHVRTIILEANDQRVNNYPNTVNMTNVIPTEEMSSPETVGSRLEDVGINYGECARGDTTEVDVHRVHGVAVFFDDKDKDCQKSLVSSLNLQRLNDNATQINSDSRNIRIKIKYLDDMEKWVFSDIKQTILAFKRDNFAEELTRDLNIRLIYNGQELKENDRILEQYGLVNNCTIHCLVTQPRSNAPLLTSQELNTGVLGSDRSDTEIGSLLFPLFGALLMVIWYCRICYRHYFNVITTFALIGMTIIYLIAFITCFNFGNSSYTVNHNHQPHFHGIRASRTSDSISSSSQTTRISFTSTFSSF